MLCEAEADIARHDSQTETRDTTSFQADSEKWTCDLFLMKAERFYFQQIQRMIGYHVTPWSEIKTT